MQEQKNEDDEKSLGENEILFETDETFLQQRERHAINPIRDKKCPGCGGITLEREILGYEELIFCTNCEYSTTVNL